MIVLDASILIAHLNPADSHHVDATRMLLIAPPGSLLVHSMTLAEVLVGGARIGRGAQMQTDLLATGIQITQHDQDEPLRLAELRATTGLKLSRLLRSRCRHQQQRVGGHLRSGTAGGSASARTSCTALTDW